MADAARPPAHTLLRVDPDSGIPLAVQLRQQMTWLIVSGQLQAGDELPTVRALGATLGINFHTVRATYQALDADGLIRTGRGRRAVVLPHDRERWSARSPDLPTFTLGILVPNYSPYYTPFLQGIQEATQADPWLLFVCETDYYRRAVGRTIDQLVAKGVDGLIFTHIETPHVAEIQEILARFRRLPPIVFADSLGMDGSSVLFDREGGGFRATRHLLEHGHRRIAMITPSLSWASMSEVHSGYRRALAADGQRDGGTVETVEGFTLEAGAEAAARLLDGPSPPTAILATGDVLAIGAIQAARARGLAVGADLAVVGFGEIDFASVVEPPLTTVSLPAHRMGVEAMTMLRRLIGNGGPLHDTQLEVKLVIRQSCGPHP